jgi:hypothetical protein
MSDPALLTLPLIHAHLLRTRASLPSLRFVLPCLLDLKTSPREGSQLHAPALSYMLSCV